MTKRPKYKSLAEITCKYANFLSVAEGARFVRDILVLYPKIANTRPFQKYVADHVDFITSSKITRTLKSEQELIIEDVEKRLSVGEKFQGVADRYGMSCEELKKLVNASPPEAVEMLKDHIYLI